MGWPHRFAIAVAAVTAAWACNTSSSKLLEAPPAALATPTHAPIDLAGDWKYLPHDGASNLADESIDDAGWPTMALPTSWYLMGSKTYPVNARATARLMENGSPGDLPPPPKDVGFDYEGTVWFRKAFSWDGTSTGVPVIDLDMVDYYAEVFVNGVALGRHEGYFQRWSVDASKPLRVGNNVIAVKVSAPALPFDLAQQYPMSWPKNQNQIKGIFAYHDTRPGATSLRGQERGTGGILRGIGLRVSSGVDLVEVKVTPRDVSEASARLVVEVVTHNWGPRAVDATFAGTIRAKNFTSADSLPISFAVAAAPGITRSVGEVTIAKPALWWSWDYGKPNLYALEGKLTYGPAVLDTKTVAFGVRSIVRDDAWVVRLNGQRIYVRGSNYIATQWLSQADRAFYETDLKLVIAANLNSLRVHAHLERPEFYEAADELGVLIWQDFPLQWGYSDGLAFHDEAKRQALDMLDRYYDHPSIIVWCMHNEAPHAMDWMKKRDAQQNAQLDGELLAVAKSNDPARIAHRDSGTGDAHTYPGWYGGNIGDLVKGLPKERMVTEYGAEALPVRQTLEAMFDKEALWPDTPLAWQAWRFADFQVSENLDGGRIKMGKNLDEFIAASQRYQANLIRFQTEVFRRAKWTKNTGIYQFMFVDDWPSITWSVVDYYRRPKLGYTVLQSSMQRLLPSIEYDIHKPDAPIALWVVNDLLQPLPKAKVGWKITGAAPQERVIDIPADDVVKVADLGVLPIATSATTLEVWIEDDHGKHLSDSRLTRDDFVR
jgi:beta-mannosidase